MSTQSQVNASVCQYILYYIGVGQSDAGVFPTDLSGVCDIAFGVGDVVICNNWTLGGSYPAPSNATLLGYAPADVLTWYEGYYSNPAAIGANQPESLTSTKIAALRTNTMPIGYTLYNSTAQRQQYWDGTVWVSMW